MESNITIYSYYRSSCSWRLRLALELKKLDYKIHPINLLKGEQLTDSFEQINPSKTVPAFVENDIVLSQSVAILEYLEEAYNSGQAALLPKDPQGRALVRQLVQVIAADCQPLQNLNVLKKLSDFAGKEDEMVREEWGKFYIEKGLKAFEMIVNRVGGRYSYGNQVTLGDLVLIPQLYNAKRFGIDVAGKFSVLDQIEMNFKADFPTEYQRAHPENQPDCPMLK